MLVTYPITIHPDMSQKTKNILNVAAIVSPFVAVFITYLR